MAIDPNLLENLIHATKKVVRNEGLLYVNSSELSSFSAVVHMKSAKQGDDIFFVFAIDPVVETVCFYRLDPAILSNQIPSHGP